MPIGDPAQIYFKDGIWAYDATAKAWVKLQADDNGYLKVAETSPISGFATAANQTTMITALQSLQNLVGALHDVGLDELDVNVLSSVLPTNAALDATVQAVRDRIGALTSPAAGSTNKLLTDALTALQLIDDLRGALDSVASDELLTIFHSQDVDVEVKQQAPADLTVAMHGWDLTNWRKNPLVWGYTDTYADKDSESNVSANTHTLTLGTIDPGYVARVTCFTAFCSTANPSRIGLYAVIDSVTYTVALFSPVVAYSPFEAPGDIILGPGDQVFAEFVNCALNDDIWVTALGYQMKINE